MNIVVTGGAGFVGTNLIKRLIEDGHDVASVDNYSTGLKSNQQKGCFYVTHDVTKITDYSFLKPDIIFHMAAIARIQPSFEDPLNYFETNATGTFKIAKYCAENNIPLIYAGSSSHHSGKFKNPYTFSKDIGEEITQLFNFQFGLKSSIARFYNVYGPHQLTEGGYTTLIGRWMNNIKNGHECEIFGDGTKRRDFTHVDDIVDGLVKIMLNQSYGHIFEFGRGKNYSVNQVATMFNIKPIYKEDKPGEAQATLAENWLARQELDWKPKKNLKNYINEFNNQ